MRLDEIVSLHDVIKADQFIKLLTKVKPSTLDSINVARIKNQVLSSWKKGMKSRKHYSRLLDQINLSLSDLIDK